MLRKFLSVSAFCAAIGLLALPLSCERDSSPPAPQEDGPSTLGLSPEQVASLLSVTRIGQEQMEEVFDAVSLSSENGYDEEYTMADLFDAPGRGVGGYVTRAPRTYASPMRERLGAAVLDRTATKSGAPSGLSAEDYLSSLAASGLQIYWPYSENWDGKTLPVVTFDPEDDIAANVGYEMHADGTSERVIVTEEMAAERPVWVVNRNVDAAFRALPALKRESLGATATTKASSGDIKSLLLRSFTAHRNFDSWLAGGSEFWVKVGAVDDFTASTEAELRLYQPTITDFLIVVKRKQVGKELTFDALLVSEWTPQLTDIAFMIVEDDGGSRTSWKCSATVKYSSKNYGFDLELPLNNRDDIVWRGQLSRSFVEKYSAKKTHFGDVTVKLELM